MDDWLSGPSAATRSVASTIKNKKIFLKMFPVICFWAVNRESNNGQVYEHLMCSIMVGFKNPTVVL